LYSQCFTVLASGSKGNSTVVCGGRTRILVDAGLSCRELFRRMKLADEAPEALDAIVITHEHQDHVNGLAVTARKLGIPVYFTEATHRAWTRWLTPRRQMTYKQWLELCRKQAAERQAEPEAPALDAATEESEFEDAGPEEAEVECLVQAGAASQPADIDPGLAAEPALAHSSRLNRPRPSRPPLNRPRSSRLRSSRHRLRKTPHGYLRLSTFAPACRFPSAILPSAPSPSPTMPPTPLDSFFSSEGVRMGFATDLGYIPPNVKQQLQDLDLLLLESNHDLEMLRDGPYPWSVKQRVLSRVGHLSNDATAEFLSSAYDGQAAYVILAHLSENNNLPELARVAAERALLGRASLLANRLLLAEQHQPLSAIRF
jgi:phosphoribosyl 1,2-cyclic phosphodiesterase